MNTIKRGTIMVVLSTLLAAACSSTGEEPSPTQPPTSDPVVIRLGTGDPRGRPDTPVVERFAAAVEEMSDGGMRVEVVWEAGDDTSDPDGFEKGVVQLVQDGELELGWIAARAWDTVGVTSFQALQAPFLITDQELLTEVLAGPMPDEMIAGLEDAGVVGLGLYPDGTAVSAGLRGADGLARGLRRGRHPARPVGGHRGPGPGARGTARVRACGRCVGRGHRERRCRRHGGLVGPGRIDRAEWRRDPWSPATWCCSPASTRCSRGRI